MNRFRRNARNVATATLFGCIATGLSAWLLALIPLSTRGPIGLHTNSDSNDPLKAIQVCESLGFGAARYEWAPLTPLKPNTDFDSIYALWKSRSDDGAARLERDLNARMFIHSEIPIETFVHPNLWPNWARMPTGRAITTGLAMDEGRACDARGFPFLAFTCNTHVLSTRTGARPCSLQWGIPLSRSSRTIGAGWKSIPLCPLIPGLLGNITFFGFVWLALPFCIRRIRAATRRDAGNCPQCGYELKGDFGPGCPECGWNRTAPTTPS